MGPPDPTPSGAHSPAPIPAPSCPGFPPASRPHLRQKPLQSHLQLPLVLATVDVSAAAEEGLAANRAALRRRHLPRTGESATRSLLRRLVTSDPLRGGANPAAPAAPAAPSGRQAPLQVLLRLRGFFSGNPHCAQTQPVASTAKCSLAGKGEGKERTQQLGGTAHVSGHRQGPVETM